MNHQRYFGFGALITACLFCGSWAGAQEKTPTPSSPKTDPRLERMSWIAGHWTLDRQGDKLEEIWAAPRGDAMMGMFRWIKDGKTWIYELCTITVEGVDIYFRLRHFASPSLAAWEEKDAALTLKLVSQDAGQVIFQSDKLAMPKTYTISKTAEGITIRTEGLRDGLPVGEEFAYKRMAE